MVTDFFVFGQEQHDSQDQTANGRLILFFPVNLVYLNLWSQPELIYFIRLVIFLGNRPDLLPFDFLISPFLPTGARRLSLAGQPDFWLQAGASRPKAKRQELNKIRTRNFFMYSNFILTQSSGRRRGRSQPYWAVSP